MPVAATHRGLCVASFAVRMHNGSRSFRGGNNDSSAGGGFASVDPIHPHTGDAQVDGSVATTSKSSSLVLDPKHVRSHTEDLERMVAGLGDEGSAAAANAPLPPSLASAQVSAWLWLRLLSCGFLAVAS